MKSILWESVYTLPLDSLRISFSLKSLLWEHVFLEMLPMDKRFRETRTLGRSFESILGGKRFLETLPLGKRFRETLPGDTVTRNLQISVSLKRTLFRGETLP